MLNVNCNTIPGIEKLDPLVLQECQDLFNQKGQRTYQGQPLPLGNPDYFNAVIWQTPSSDQLLNEMSWNTFAQSLLNVPTSEFYNPKLPNYFNMSVFDSTIKATVNLESMNAKARDCFYKLIKTIVGVRLYVCVLVEKPPFPFKETSRVLAKLQFEKLKEQGAHLEEYKSLESDQFFSNELAKLSNSRERALATQITYPFVKQELMKCGTRVDVNPISVWHAQTPLQRRALLRVLIQALGRAAHDSKNTSINKLSLAILRSQLVGYTGVSQFDPRVAFLILCVLRTKYNHPSYAIIDPTAGWGERLVAALAYMQLHSNEVHYFTGIDQNPHLKAHYDEIVANLHPDNSKSIVRTITSAIQDLPELGEHDTLITSPPYITKKQSGLVEKYEHLNHLRFNKENWWDTVMLAILMHGKKDKLPQDGAISVLIINQYMREKLKTTFLNRFNQEVLFEMPYPASFSKRRQNVSCFHLVDKAQEVIIAYRRAVRAPVLVDLPMIFDRKSMNSVPDTSEKRALVGVENDTAARNVDENNATIVERNQSGVSKLSFFRVLVDNETIAPSSELGNGYDARH